MIAVAARDTPPGDRELDVRGGGDPRRGHAVRPGATRRVRRRAATSTARWPQGDTWGAHALAALLAAEAAHRGRTGEAVVLADRALAGGRLLAERGAGAWACPRCSGR